jgi:hypothetical protein
VEPSWFGALKKEIVHVLQVQSTHIPADVKLIVQPKCEPAATEECGCSANFFARTTYYCLLRNVIWGADFKESAGRLRDVRAPVQCGAQRPATSESSFAERAPLS